MNLRTVAALLLTPSLWAADPSILQIKTVYLMPMGAGLDQFLAGRLTEEGVFSIVTDPALADAVFTDRLGTSFEQQFANLFPEPPAPAPAPAAEGAKPAEPAKSADAAKIPADQSIGSMLAGLPEAPPRVSSFSRGRGNLFLVDRKTKRVLWSEYRRAKNTRPDEMNRTAARLVGDLQQELRDLQKQTASR